MILITYPKHVPTGITPFSGLLSTFTFYLLSEPEGKRPFTVGREAFQISRESHFPWCSLMFISHRRIQNLSLFIVQLLFQEHLVGGVYVIRAKQCKLIDK